MRERFFNNAGPVDPTRHYCLDPLGRIVLEDIEALIDQQRYFVLHAPRQTGKTTSLLALAEHLNVQGRYLCVYLNVEAGQSAREDIGRAMRAILNELADRAEFQLGATWPREHMEEALASGGGEGALGYLLSRWAKASDRPLVLLIDEVDTLIGDSLVSLLRQLRAGYDKRPTAFPQTLILCGVRDVRDYRIQSSRSPEIITGGSAFNVKAESIRLGNFTQGDVVALYRQHTEETGQSFGPDALERVWYLTQGQPWLVNALGYEVTFRRKDLRDRTICIERADIDGATETLIQRRDTHLDQLTDKLREERVRRVIAPILAGEEAQGRAAEDDIQYVLDLGLVDRTSGVLAIANPIYREIIPRQLTYVQQIDLEAQYQTAWYLMPDGHLDLSKLLAAFQGFFREHSEHWLARFDYQEAGPQLLVQAFLQRIVNGGGRIEREYGLGRMRTDLLVLWPHPGGVQKAVLELKVLHKGLDRTLAEGLEQTWAYLDRCGAEEGHLLIFDRSARPWEEKLYRREEVYRGKRIGVWGM